ncbi:MAG: FecR family protein [Chitinophagaceae bacterium]|nr:FecR family protein [Chitinophagaceae bacterium]
MKKPSLKQLFLTAAILPLFLSCGSGDDSSALKDPPTDLSALPDAILKLSDGRQIRLDSNLNKAIEAEPGCSLSVKNGKLIYHSIPDSAVKYAHTLSVSKGNRFGVVFPDSSEASMNAQTKITYPVSFKGALREIRLDGEMFIKVHKTGEIPLLVRITTDYYYAAVSGKFNVNSYHGSYGLTLSVFEDSVTTFSEPDFHPGRHNLKELYASSKSFTKALTSEHQELDGRYRESPLDSMQAIGWLKNRFNFDYMDLPAAMEEISRWYDVEVEYDGEIPYFDYVETPGRDTPLPTLLKLMESAGVKFTLKNNGRKIVVKAKKR